MVFAGLAELELKLGMAAPEVADSISRRIMIRRVTITAEQRTSDHSDGLSAHLTLCFENGSGGGT
ncbi:hypothetical protein [Sphingomonas jejuensis]|uniref:hypothetical protein n=1 Tax=Sphingomonas jejuensis TaxID=904715 RepID=UPI00143A1B27|nr:hypothetical protein [Sphingomonas jejuensis]